MEITKEYHINNSTVRVLFGNIIDSKADVIVSTASSTMNMGGGLGKAIREAGGETIRDDAKTKLPVKLGDAIATTAGRLSQKYIFHCITIDISVDKSCTPNGIDDSEISQYIVGHSIDKCFQMLHVMDLTSIAIPAIGAGGAGIPIQMVAEVMAETIGKNLRKTNKSILVEIYLLDCHGNVSQWDYLPIFEQFSSQESLSKVYKEQTEDRLTYDVSLGQNVMESSVSNMEKDVFISYSRKDSEVVTSLYKRLEQSGLKCWIDIDGMYSGTSFKKVIVDAIKNSKVLLFVSSENSNQYRNVVNEVSVAIERGKKIIPVKLDMTPYSESIEYDLINHDFLFFDPIHFDIFSDKLVKRIASVFNMDNK